MFGPAACRTALTRSDAGLTCSQHLDLSAIATMSESKLKLDSLVALGARLRELRKTVGLSQMKLSEKLGFNPAHGYKYVLRLEKGQVPNPTLRTIAAVLASCGATWSDIADVLPGVPAVTPHRPKPKASRPDEPAPACPAPAEPAPRRVRRRDGRPVRELLRQRRLEEKARQAEIFWTRTRLAESRIHELLEHARVPAAVRAGYIDYARAQCRALFDRLGPGQKRFAPVEASVGRGPGLDSAVADSVRVICLETWAKG